MAVIQYAVAAIREAPGRPPALAVQPRVTFLAAAWNEANNIAAFIDSFRQLEYPDKELVLCAGGSDATYEQAIARGGKGVKVLRQRHDEGKQAALRKAFRAATGEVIVLTDADSLLSTDAVGKLLTPILLAEEQVTTGISRPKGSQMSDPFVLYQYALELIGLTRIQGNRYASSLLGRNCAMLRTVLEEVGGFTEDVPTGTDSFLAKKIAQRGHRIRFVPESVVETDYEANVWDFCRQRSRWTRNGIINSVRFRLYRRLMHGLAPSIIGLGLFGLPFISIWLGSPVLLLWGGLSAVVYVRHVRYVGSLFEAQQRPLSAAIVASVAVYMWAEWGAHVLALFQLPFARLRRSW